MTNTATSGTRKTTTNAEGLYTFPALPPGNYELKVELQGFKTAEVSAFKVDIQQTVRRGCRVGGRGAQRDGDGQRTRATLLNTESTTVGTVIENKVVTELPLNGRQYLNLVAIAPNVNVLSPAAGQAGARLGGERAQQSISAGGQRIFFNYYTLDGVNNTDPNFNNYIALPSIDAIQEFKVQTGVYPAEFGHQSTQVNVVTKSGGNTFHGSVFEFLRDEKFDAKPYAFTSVHPDKSPFKWNDLRLRGGRPGLARQVVLHGQLRGAAPSADHAEHVHGAERQDVHRRLQRDPAGHGDLRPTHRPAVPRQRHPGEPDRPHFAEPVGGTTTRPRFLG